jgi:hypothetical protein
MSWLPAADRPCAYLACEEVQALGEGFAVTVEPLPYAIALEAAFGTPETLGLRESAYLGGAGDQRRKRWL